MVALTEIEAGGFVNVWIGTGNSLPGTKRYSFFFGSTNPEEYHYVYGICGMENAIFLVEYISIFIKKWQSGRNPVKTGLVDRAVYIVRSSGKKGV
jgi:hypothetical protein